MGLQGWDASYEFQSQSMPRKFNDRAGWLPWGVWEADVPTQLGQYPALARMVLRGDVQESPVISVRRVSPEELAAGKFSFSDKVTQQGDVKSFGGTVPAEALAAGRVAVEFTDQPQAVDVRRSGQVSPRLDDRRGHEATGLEHRRPRAASRSIAPGTKAVVGFAQGKQLKLDNLSDRGRLALRLDLPDRVAEGRHARHRPQRPVERRGPQLQLGHEVLRDRREGARQRHRRRSCWSRSRPRSACPAARSPRSTCSITTAGGPASRCRSRTIASPSTARAIGRSTTRSFSDEVTAGK